MTGSSSWISKSRRLALYIRSEFRCAYCGRNLKDARPEEMGLDHLENLVDGGGHTGADHANSNLVMACRSCNSSRKNRIWTDFAPGGAQDRISELRYLPVNIEIAKGLLQSRTKWSDQGR